MVWYVDPTIWIESIVCKYKGFMQRNDFFFWGRVWENIWVWLLISKNPLFQKLKFSC